MSINIKESMNIFVVLMYITWYSNGVRENERFVL